MIDDRFRFRAWNGKAMECFELFDYDYTPKFDVLMQCTGLKDKNGKLIYEGDILLHHHRLFDWQGDPIEWGEAMETCGGGAGIGYSMTSACASDAEIIGNIYSNPELLEQP